jgi:hypothetical protein
MSLEWCYMYFVQPRLHVRFESPNLKIPTRVADAVMEMSPIKHALLNISIMDLTN